MLTIFYIRKLKEWSEGSLRKLIFALITTMGFLGAALIWDLITFPFFIIGVVVDKIGKYIDKYFEENEQKKIPSDIPFKVNVNTKSIYKYIGNSKVLKIQCEINGIRLHKIGSYFNSLNKKDEKQSTECSDNIYANFEGNPIEELEISDGFFEIGSAAFRNNKLKSLVLPGSIRTIYECAFFNNQINNLKLSDNLVEIRDNAFGNNSIENLILPENLITLGEGVFKNNSIRKLYINDALEIIEKNCFINNSLKEVIIGKSVRKIGTSSFENNLIEKIFIPTTVKEISLFAFANNTIKEIHIEGDPYRFNHKWERIGFPIDLIPK